MFNKKQIALRLPAVLQLRNVKMRRVLVSSLPMRQDGLLEEHVYPKKYDLNRPMPDYNSPYFGPSEVTNKSGFSEEYDMEWNNAGVQHELIFTRTQPHVPNSLIWLQFFYLTGWIIAAYTIYVYVFRNNEPLHPATYVLLTSEENVKAKRMIAQRKEDMEKYGISADTK